MTNKRGRKKKQANVLSWVVKAMTWIGASICMLGWSTLYAQETDSLLQAPKFRIDSGLINRLQRFGQEEAVRSRSRFEADKRVLRQEALFENIKLASERARRFLKAGIDSASIKKELDNIESWMKVAGDGVFFNKGSLQTDRNLTTSAKILQELQKRTEARQHEVERFIRQLNQFKFDIDSLNSDSILYNFSGNPEELRQYLQKVWVLANEIGSQDTALQKAIVDTESLEVRVRLLHNRIQLSLDEIAVYHRHLSVSALQKDVALLNEAAKHSRDMSEIWNVSLAKTKLIFFFYVSNNSGKVWFLVFMTVVITAFLTSLRKMVRQHSEVKALPQLVLKYPFLSGLLLGTSIFQFIFPAPPFIFNLLLWTIAALSLTIIFSGYIKRYWLLIWLLLLSLFLLAGIENLVLQASRQERWIMLILASTGFIFGTGVLLNAGKQDLREKLILYFIGLMVIMELLSILLNISGRYNFAKSMLTCGYLNVIIGILFLWCVRLINEGLALATKVYSYPNKKLFYINFDKVGNRAPLFVYFLLIGGWFILIGRNFYSFHLITDPVKTFLQAERTVGNYTFTINSALIFFVIMGIAILISKIVSFFATDRHLSHNQTVADTSRSRIGSWILLIRISIICTGLFLALAATGIPLDRITIVLGAIGVGVGLGLQALVNNLVSGLIIAFERPVNVGDLVEVGGQTGIMKSIGFRSSVISTGDGADVIMPNGDLLSSHLVNRSLSGNKRRIEILFSIGYGANLEEVRNGLADILGQIEKIIPYPAPLVFIDNLSKNTIDVRLFFWVGHYLQVSEVKSEVIEAAYLFFETKGIRVPVPEQEIRIKMDETRPADSDGQKPKEV